MNLCFCHRLYGVNKPTTIRQYAFSGSLCRLREFETSDGLRFCMTVFSLSNYKHLHFPHYEYKSLMCKLSVLLSTEAIVIFNNSTWKESNDSRVTITQLPFDGDFKIKFGSYSLTIGQVSAFGLLKTSPFTFDGNNDLTTTIEKHFTCDPKWDICACKSCPVFKRLINFEETVNEKCSYRNIILP